LVGKKLSELSDYDAGIFVRTMTWQWVERLQKITFWTIVSYETSDSSFSSYSTIQKECLFFRNGAEENISMN
jgi:hypothetical protein